VKALFCSLDARGFLYPLIGAALEMTRSGDSVAFVTNVTFAEELARLGLPRCARSQPDGESFHIQLWGHPLSIAIQSEHVSRAIAEFRPDVVVTSELAIGPLLAARRSRVPVVVLGLATLPWSTPADRSPAVVTPRASRARWRRRELDRIIAGVMGLGMDVAGLGSPLELAATYLLQSTQTMVDAAGISLPEHVRLVGNCGWEPEWVEEDLQRWLEQPRGEVLIYAHQGTAFGRPRFWESLVGAVGDRRFALCGSYGRNTDMSDVTTRRLFARRHVPQRRVLDIAKVVVSSATTTPVLGALARELPLVLVPAGGEQADLAEVCGRFDGVSTVAPEDVTPERLAGAIDEVLTASHRSRVGADLRAHGGAAAVVRAIHDVREVADAAVGVP
jgi:UDP:flavonoid glycosyltransferase YjiC (YdhE family)